MKLFLIIYVFNSISLYIGPIEGRNPEARCLATATRFAGAVATLWGQVLIANSDGRVIQVKDMRFECVWKAMK